MILDLDNINYKYLNGYTIYQLKQICDKLLIIFKSNMKKQAIIDLIVKHNDEHKGPIILSPQPIPKLMLKVNQKRTTIYDLPEELFPLIADSMHYFDIKNLLLTSKKYSICKHVLKKKEEEIVDFGYYDSKYYYNIMIQRYIHDRIVGRYLYELKDICKKNGLKSSMNKHELAYLIEANKDKIPDYYTFW